MEFYLYYFDKIILVFDLFIENLLKYLEILPKIGVSLIKTLKTNEILSKTKIKIRFLIKNILVRSSYFFRPKWRTQLD
jgi:hypothetical protein